jgi:hypothetical protein
VVNRGPAGRHVLAYNVLLAHMQFSKIANPGGADRDRTDDIQLAKLALSQLSYGPGLLGTSLGDTNRGCAAHHVPGAPRCIRTLVGLGRFELPTPRLSSVCSNQLSYRPSTQTQHPRISKNQRQSARSLKTGQEAHERLRTPFDLLLLPAVAGGRSSLERR